MKRPPSLPLPPLALLAVLTLVGFLLVVTGSATSLASQREEPRRQALIDQIQAERRNVGDLDKAVSSLREDLEARQLQAGRQSQQQNEANRRQEALALEAATLPVKGPGITVKLADAPTQSNTESAVFDASRIQDSDIQLIVNALFAVGAEAVAINDSRISAITPIRAAGGTIVVNYRPVSSPYRIVAIGADIKQFNETDIADHFRQWKKKFNLGFSIDKSSELTVPGYAGRVAIDVAEPVEVG